MSRPYRLNERDRQVLAAVERLLKELVQSGALRPAQLVSVAKVLHALSRLPQVSEDVCVTIELSWRIQQDGCSNSSTWQFSVGSDWLNLSIGGSEYTEEIGSDSFTTMSWTASPGERTDYDGSWDDSWMRQDEYADTPVHSEDFRGCSISVDDDDNELRSDSDLLEEEDPDPWLELSRDCEKIKLTQTEWRAAIQEFHKSGWEPDVEDLDVYSTPGISIGHDDGLAMQEAGYRLWRMIDQNAVLAQSVGLDTHLFFSLTKFVGKGQFAVRNSDSLDGR